MLILRFRWSWLCHWLTPCWALFPLFCPAAGACSDGSGRAEHDPIASPKAARSTAGPCRPTLSGRATSTPKDATVAGIRALRNAARSAVKARTAALNQITHILFTAPETIRARFRRLNGTNRTDALARLRPAGDAIHIAVLSALRSLARRVRELTAEHEELTRALDREVTAHNPGLRGCLRGRSRHCRPAAGHGRRQSRADADGERAAAIAGLIDTGLLIVGRDGSAVLTDDVRYGLRVLDASETPSTY
ncbi:hypothetical protein [Streptomyces sp. NBC_00236]|uniref:hypothetical protein n=1 Tax=Streptomyces sp. NBC_00236 TaxID=2903639 RepID=UPI002E2AB819|nr:hypothetical protein [Streptomyces sp. NBC_00236]